MRALFFDTETTGLPLFKEPSEDPRQPHLVQLAASLIDLETRREIASIDVTVRPDGWVIPDDTAAIHGITTEIARANGIDEGVAVTAFYQLWLLADVRVAHNQDFDARIMRIAIKRFLGEAHAERWKTGASQCTCNQATPILDLPPTPKMIEKRVPGPKKASLEEALLYFTGRKQTDAHSARGDTIDCRDVFFAIRDGGKKFDAVSAAA